MNTFHGTKNEKNWSFKPTTTVPLLGRQPLKLIIDSNWFINLFPPMERILSSATRWKSNKFLESVLSWAKVEVFMYMVVIFSVPLFFVLVLLVFLWSSFYLVVTTFRRLALFWWILPLTRRGRDAETSWQQDKKTTTGRQTRQKNKEEWKRKDYNHVHLTNFDNLWINSININGP